MQIQLWKITQPKNSRFFGAQPELNAGTADSLLPISFFPAGKKNHRSFLHDPSSISPQE